MGYLAWILFVTAAVIVVGLGMPAATLWALSELSGAEIQYNWRTVSAVWILVVVFAGPSSASKS